MARRLAAGVVILGTLIGLIMVALRSSPAGPILGSVPIGSPQGYPQVVGVDSRTRHAFILDDGLTQRQVTLSTGGGYSWSSSGALTNEVHVINTQTGRLVTTVSVPQTMQSLAVDEATGRVFAFDQGQIQLIDAQSGKLLTIAPLSGDAGGPTARVDAALADGRSGHLFATMALNNYSGLPAPQHLLMFDGRTGHTLHDLTFPHGQGLVEHQPNGVTTTYYPPSLWPALDARAGRLYVFNTNREVSVIDTASGRLLSTRRLPVALANPVVDARTGHIFALTMPRQQARSTTTTRPLPSSTLVMLDPRSGAMHPLITSIATVWPGTPPGTLNDIALDDATGHVVIVNTLHHTVDVIDATSGRLLQTTAMSGNPYQLALDACRHRALVGLIVSYSRVFATADARLAVLDTRTGALLRTIPLTHPCYPLAVDAGNGHAVTVYNAIDDGPPDRWGWMPAWLRARVPGLPPPPPALNPNQRIMTNTALTIDPS